MGIYEESLTYHSSERKGKIEVIASKPVATQHDLTLAYSPGVAEPCRVIAQHPEAVYEYTTKGNLVAVVSNGTAVLGLGNIGPLAAKPVMEGKGILFKKFADIDVFDIELNANHPDDVIKACEMLEPTFGGINLEDIKAPECFYIEEQLRKKLNIPVFHDDQHGTAVISAAAFLNALEIVGKKIEQVKVVFCGSGAAAIACAKLYLELGVQKHNILMADSKGILTQSRWTELNPYKQAFCQETDKTTIEKALEGADAFVGVSVKGAITESMILKMAPHPIIFAMANPDPEITPEQALHVRPDAILATGRSDYPNQVNNVLGFPFIFRGALDTRATQINEAMKLAAVKAIAELAKQDVPDSVVRAYGGQKFQFGKDYLIPKPFDPRALLWVSHAVAKAAMDSGVARISLDLDQYYERLERQLGSAYTIMRNIKNKAKERSRPKIVFPEGEEAKILRAAQIVWDEGLAEPILLGKKTKIQNLAQKLNLPNLLTQVTIIDPNDFPLHKKFSKALFHLRHRKGMTLSLAQTYMKNANYCAAMLVKKGMADGLVSGLTQSYPDALRPLLKIIGVKKGSLLAAINIIILKKRVLLFADTTVNIKLTAEQLCEVALETADFAKRFLNEEPRVAMLSFSNFGSNQHPLAQRVAKATELIRQKNKTLVIDGEMQADTAVFGAISDSSFPFNEVPGTANVLIFPNLAASNIAYKLLTRLAAAESIGPILVGMRKPVFVLEQNADVNEIVNIVAIATKEVSESRKA
jgi:malate dehydrogenase (oxaloacetate-decarboxylating)(NADP+)